MVGYGASPCQRRTILDHFGEQPSWERCGRCTGCHANRPIVSTPRVLAAAEVESVRKVLACMARMQRPFSASMIARVVTGSRDKTIRTFGFDRLSTHGILTGWTQSRVEALLDALVQAGAIEAIRITREMRGQARTYQNLRLTPFGRDVMMGDEAEIKLVLPSAQAPAIPHTTGPVDNDLLARLKVVRLSLAREEGVPAYVVAPNRTLEAMAAHRPTSETALSEIHGMGPQRIARYGAAFVDTVRGWSDPSDGPHAPA